MGAKKLMNVHEALEYLKNLDASSEDDLSDNEDFISKGRLVFHLQTTRVIKIPMKIREIKMNFSQTI